MRAWCLPCRCCQTALILSFRTARPLLEGSVSFIYSGRVGVLVFNSLFKIKKNTNPDVNIDIDGINLANVPQRHIAIIMDGNGRWAKAREKCNLGIRPG